MSLTIHPIMAQSFAVIDREIGTHNFSSQEYAIVRRVIHSTADFEFKDLIRFSPGAIDAGIAAIRRRVPIVTDVGMVKQGIVGLVGETFANPVISAVEGIKKPLPGKTRTETGLLKCWQEFPQAIFVFGNAPTALLALCQEIPQAAVLPALVIGAPVGFISVVESKMTLATTEVPQIRVEGRKGGSPVAAAILNALICLATEGEV
ncbi:cobalt-precorrin-8X methylmutase [Floridanema evergladense]|uniref:Cobalt-precorrin-8X methylmutase n=1 Tax=Floridaenema evergladense BLCC-F167 TaxID=3153639 RepID=A0ABV4WQS7_9CYAN